MRFKEFINEGFTENWISRQSTDFLKSYLKTRKGIRLNTKLKIEKELQNRINSNNLFKNLKNKVKTIENHLKENKISEAIKEYLDVADQFNPILNKLSEINLSRKDEQTKFKNLKSTINRLKYSFNIEKFNSLDDESKKWFLIVNLENLNSELNTIKNMMNRFDEYLNIQKEFKYKQFQIINQYGYKREEYQDALKTLDKASDYLKNAGFENLLNGKIVLHGIGSVKNKNQSVWGFSAGHYSQGDVALNIDAQKRYNDLYTLIHEFGHKYYDKILSEKEKEEFKEFHNQNKQFITNYASTNEKENFAELFAHYVLMKNNEDKYFSNFQKELSKIIEKYKK